MDTVISWGSSEANQYGEKHLESEESESDNREKQNDLKGVDKQLAWTLISQRNCETFRASGNTKW